MHRSDDDLTKGPFSMALATLLNSIQERLLHRNGNLTSRWHLEELRSAMDALRDDTDLTRYLHENQVNVYQVPACESTQVLAVIHLLQEMLVAASAHDFQQRMEELKIASGIGLKSDCFRLPGLKDLALEIQRNVLQAHGFEGTRKGLFEAMALTSEHLENPLVS